MAFCVFKLSLLVTATGLFDTEIREEGPSHHKAIYVRYKKQDK